MQVIAARISDANVNALNSSFLLSPVVAVLGFSAEGSLSRCQCKLVPPEAIERRVEPAVAQRRETDDSHVDAYRRPSRNRAFDLPLRQDRYKPFLAGIADSDIPQPTQDIAAVAVAQPTEPR